MIFPDMLRATIERASTPDSLQSETSQALAAGIRQMLWNWIAAHMPEDGDDSEFDAGYRALAVQLLAELEGSAILPE